MLSTIILTSNMVIITAESNSRLLKLWVQNLPLQHRILLLTKIQRLGPEPWVVYEPYQKDFQTNSVHINFNSKRVGISQPI